MAMTKSATQVACNKHIKEGGAECAHPARVTT